MAGLDDLPFRVELWDDGDIHVFQLIAAADNLLVAKAAYEAAVKLGRPANLYPRHKARVVEKARG